MPICLRSSARFLAAILSIGWATAAAQQAAPREGPLGPVEAVASLVPRPGMQVELTAAEPLVADPINLDWGPDGRLWIVEMGDYPSGADGHGAPGGQIRCLTDDDGDGRYDRSQIFLDALPYPTAVLAWRDGVLVMAAAELLFAADRDGDGRAEHRETLWGGFHTGNPQHLATGFRRGLDGWVYGGNIQPGTIVRCLRSGKFTDLGGHDFRFHPERGEIEALSGVTQFLRTRDDWGNWFGNNNINPMYHYALDERRLKRNPYVAYPPVARDVSDRPGSAPVFPRSRTLPRFNDFHTANRFTSACSAIVYRDELLGPELAGASFVSEPVHNLVHREVLRAEGVSFRSRRADDEQASEFLASTDNWFRPTTIETGPDGALWVVDMYRQVIEHPEWIPPDLLAKLDVTAGAAQGRLYRVFPADRRPRKIPRLDTLSDLELVTALDHPSGWQRDMAAQLLRERGAKGATEALRKLAREAARPIAKVHALYVLADFGLDLTTWQAAAADAHPGVRRHAAALAAGVTVDARARDHGVAQLTADADPLVRLEAAYALGDAPSPANAAALVRLGLAERDDDVYAAALSSLAAQSPSALVDEVRRAGMSHARAEAFLGDLLTTLWGESRDAATPDDAPLIELLEMVAAQPLDARRRGALAQMAAGLLRQGHSAGKPIVESELHRQRVAALLRPVVDEATGALADTQRPTPERLACLPLLALDSADDSEARLTEIYGSLLQPSTPRALQAAAVDALARLESSTAADALLAAWPRCDAALRDAIADVLLRRDAWRDALVSALKEERVAATQLSTTHRQRLASSDDAELARLLAASTASPDERRVIVERYRRECGSGDAARGQRVFAARCATCHRLHDEGHAVGPELTALVGRAPEALLEAILDPNRALESRFMAYTAVTDEGLTYQGVFRGETAGVVTLVGPEGKLYELPRAKLETLEPTNRSLMPEGFDRDITPAQMSDLLAYFGAQRPSPKRVDGNEPALVAPDPLRRELFCLPENAELYGPALTLEHPDRNLGGWSSEQDYAAWTVDAPRAERYAVLLEWACTPEAAGDSLIVESGAQRVSHRVASTGGASQYDRAKIGELELAAGRQQVVLRADGPPRGGLLRFRGISLRPLDAD